MTRKDFELIASVIRTIADDVTRSNVARLMGMKLQLTNERFNAATFLKACDVEK